MFVFLSTGGGDGQVTVRKDGVKIAEKRLALYNEVENLKSDLKKAVEKAKTGLESLDLSKISKKKGKARQKEILKESLDIVKKLEKASSEFEKYMADYPMYV